MTIGIDASRSVTTIQKTGVEKVSDELLRQFIEVKSQKSKVKSNDFDFIFYTPQEISWLPKENQKILRWPFRFFWTQIRLGWELLFHSPKAMFFPVHAMPLLLFFTRYSLLVTRYYKVIHDIAFKKQPTLYSFKQKIILSLDLWLAKKLCAKIFVPSQAVKDDLLQYTKIKPEKIIVVPWGYKKMNNELRITRLPTPEAIGNSGQVNYGKKKKQILYIGRVEEKKNIINLIKAFEIFHEKYPDYKLTLAGKIDGDVNKYFCHSPALTGESRNKKQKEKELDPRVSPAVAGSPEDDRLGVEFLGYISEERKHQFLAESAVLALVSKEEGFGFPILEAFDFGLPVVASDIPVLREVGGDACVYVNPDSPEAIAKGLEIAVETGHGVFLSEKIEKGRERLKKFDWQKTAEQILGEILNE